MTRIIGIDPGATCGIVVLDGGQISSVLNIMLPDCCHNITNFLIHPNCTVVVEDIRPYSLRLTPQVIDTCKFIGELNFRLRTWSGANVQYVVRNHVKKWCFDAFPEICLPRIQKKIEKKGFKNKETGEWRKPSFVFVDDRIVTACMKQKYQIPDVTPGYGYKFGLKDHGWQALATAAYWEQKERTLNEFPQDALQKEPSVVSKG